MCKRFINGAGRGFGAEIARAVLRHGDNVVLVNNADRGMFGAIEEIGDDQVRALFDLDVFALLDVTRAVLPVMRGQGSGSVVTMGSRAGF